MPVVTGIETIGSFIRDVPETMIRSGCRSLVNVNASSELIVSAYNFFIAGHPGNCLSYFFCNNRQALSIFEKYILLMILFINPLVFFKAFFRSIIIPATLYLEVIL